MIFYTKADLVNFVCIVFEQGVKMLTSMENLIVKVGRKIPPPANNGKYNFFAAKYMQT